MIRLRTCRHLAAVALLLSTMFPIAIRADYEATGLIEPIWEAILAPTVLGRVEKIAVKESEQVKAGTVLVYFERDFEELDAERRKIVADSKVELDLSLAKLKVLESQFESTEQLFKNTGTVSKEELESAQLEFSLAKAEVAQLEQRERVEELEWQIAKEQFENREIRTPRAGTVVEIFPEEGEVCEPRQPVAQVVDASTVKIDLDVDANKTGRVSAGDEVPVRIEAPGGDIQVEGSVEYVSPVVDGASGLRRIRITISNQSDAILPGLTARVTLSES